jgi:hypothetical protein
VEGGARRVAITLRRDEPITPPADPNTIFDIRIHPPPSQYVNERNLSAIDAGACLGVIRIGNLLLGDG